MRFSQSVSSTIPVLGDRKSKSLSSPTLQDPVICQWNIIPKLCSLPEKKCQVLIFSCIQFSKIISTLLVNEQILHQVVKIRNTCTLLFLAFVFLDLFLLFIYLFIFISKVFTKVDFILDNK